MSTDLMPFTYQGADELRAIVIDGDPWFVLSDLCAALDISNVANVASRIDEAAVRQTDISSGGQRRKVNIVNESGMYEVVIRSDKPEAIGFRRWITGTVLPEIRKTGSFSVSESTADQIIHRALELSAARIAEMEPKAKFYDELMEADGTYSMLAASKILGWGRNVMMRELRKLGVLQGNRLPYQRYEHHFKVIPGTYTNQQTGETVPTATTYVLPSGLEFLRKKLEKSSVHA